MDEAREYDRRFYEYWKDGDVDRERVEEAKSKISQKETVPAGPDCWQPVKEHLQL